MRTQLKNVNDMFSSVCPAIWLIELDKLDTRLTLKVCHSVYIMRKIPYSYYIAQMKRISTLDQDF